MTSPWRAKDCPLFTMKELEEAIFYMRNKKAPFTGGIPVSLRPTIQYIQNMTKGGKNFPCAWKVATLTLISKVKGDPELRSPYPPLCIVGMSEKNGRKAHQE